MTDKVWVTYVQEDFSYLINNWILMLYPNRLWLKLIFACAKWIQIDVFYLFLSYYYYYYCTRIQNFIRKGRVLHNGFEPCPFPGCFPAFPQIQIHTWMIPIDTTQDIAQ